MKNAILFSSLFLIGISFQLSAQKNMFKTGMLVDEKPPKGIELYDFDALGFGETIPDSVSLLEFAPYPGNQGNYSSCVGWAYGYCGTSILYAQKHNIKNRTVITALAMCPFSIYNQIKESYDATCSKGTHMHLAAVELKKGGTKRFHLNQVGCNESSAKDSAYRIFKIDNSYAIWDIYQEKLALDSIKILNTKKALAANKPVLIGFKTTRSFCYDIRKNDGFWEKNADRLWATGGHAMCIVGYNDKKFGGAFQLQNSWGKDWGKDGYAWIAYDDYAKYTYNAYVIELADEKNTAVVSKGGCDYGNCKDNYSRFKFENGDVYEGDVKAGMPDGNGIYQYQNGDVFTGMFKKGKKDGKGTYYFNDGTIKVAYWQADTINAGADYMEYGYGKIESESSEFTGYYKGENWIFGTYTGGTSYSSSEFTGKFMDGQKDDFGFRVYSSYLYIGSISKDIYKGVYAFISTSNKRIYIYNSTPTEFKKIPNSVELAAKVSLFAENVADSLGNLDKKQCTYGDCENGYGKFTYASGNTYEGFFTNGYRNGYGVYTCKDGGKINIYDGVYFANQRNELGKVIMADGSVFIGQFDLGKKVGYGIYTDKDKKAVAGLWEDDKYTEWEDELGFGAADDPKAKDVDAITVQNNKHKTMPQSQINLK